MDDYRPCAFCGRPTPSDALIWHVGAFHRACAGLRLAVTLEALVCLFCREEAPGAVHAMLEDQAEAMAVALVKS